MKKIGVALFSAVAVIVALVGCDGLSSEPTYTGLSLEAFNYTPYNLDRFVIKDKYGNKGSGGGDLPPGSGEGRLSCCYELKGTEFEVEWEAYDADIASRDLYAPIKKIRSTTKVNISPTKIEGGSGTRILGLHFYPDGHIEPEFRSDLGGSRFNYGAINYQIVTKYGQRINPGEQLNSAEVFRRTARLAGQGWIKYRLTDDADLEQYVYFTLLVSKNFDGHPQVKKILEDTKGKPGAFAVAMKNLPPRVIAEIKAMPSSDSKGK
ncbi:hypothetical protein [Herbaspirillum sp. DW155]|uniref:hypothetical protein n=1 Tax=Herbaspirillum sp. DW155 TaxID=3095609 RepID=UPI0030D1227B